MTFQPLKRSFVFFLLVEQPRIMDRPSSEYLGGVPQSIGASAESKSSKSDPEVPQGRPTMQELMKP
jgi:hypothetical protein